MSYATTNPPQVLVSGINGQPSLWIYASTDVHTDVDAADYFSNGDALGMKVNDVVIVVKTSATIGATLHVVTAVTDGGAATVAAAILA
jgi:lipid-binding SYLF domain-containing protein